MTEANRENLSAAVDGELSKEELRFLLRRLDHDASLPQTWTRYHLASASLRRELPPLAKKDFADRVMQAIEQETGSLTEGKSSPHWLRWSAGGAIAASVAAAALMISQPTGGPEAGHLTARMTNASPQVAAVPAAGLSSSSVAPATVPPWLSGYSASPLSQRASITFGDPSDPSLKPYARSVSPYQLSRYRTVRTGDGSYLLLIDAAQPPADQSGQPQAAAGGQ